MQGRSVIVTGAGKGKTIAYGCALAFANAGANVAVVGRSKSRLTSAVQELRGCGVEALGLKLACVDEREVAGVVERVAEAFGRIDVVVNAMQAAHSGIPLAECTFADMDLALNSGLYASFAFMKAAYPHLKATKGVVVNLVSDAGVTGLPGQATLAAAKEAVRGMSRVAANEWAADGIAVESLRLVAQTAQLDQWQQQFPDAYDKMLDALPDSQLPSIEQAGEQCLQVVQNHLLHKP